MDWEAFYNSFRQPDFIPGYEIENRLGGGAFGDVYKARKSSIGKPYAIKFLKVDDDDQRVAVEQELAQAQNFAAIDHPNLVTIEDLGSAMGVPYLIMGYAGGDTLAKRFKAGDLSGNEALRYVTQAARGLSALHDRRIVHFDLKPSNIFLRGDSARLGDYGLSKLLEGGRTTLTFGRGTPLYMAPEMLRHRADHRADIYSLGVLLFEALAGEVPFKGGGALVVREEGQDPVFPEGFPELAREATSRCLRLDPGERPGSVAEVLELLGQSVRPGDDIEFDFPEAPRSARPLTAPRSTGSSRDPEAAVTPTSAGPSSKHPSSGGTGRPPTPSKSLLDGGFEVDARPEDGGAVGSGPASRARALVAELAAESKAGSTAGSKGGSTVAAVPSGDELGVAEETSAASVPVVVPVPPRVTGGLAGTLAETNRVAFDVFVGSVVAVVGGVFAAYRGLSERLVRSRRGGVAGRAFRFAVFLLLMASIGFGATLLGLLGVNVVEQLEWRP